MIWLELSDGQPDEPKTSDGDKLASYPTPDKFLERLFREISGVDVRSGSITERTRVVGDSETVRGFRGTGQIGFVWVEQRDLESSLVDLSAYVETYGLPGMTLRWWYAFAFAGQAGHAAFRHRKLQVIIDDVATKDRFAALWKAVFAKTPVFRPAPPEPT